MLIHNAVRAPVLGSFLQDKWKPEAMTKVFPVNVEALARLAKLLVPDMIAAGRGVIMSTGNTGSHRGKVWQTGFAPTKTAQQIFMEAMARDLGPQGVHVSPSMP